MPSLVEQRRQQLRLKKASLQRLARTHGMIAASSKDTGPYFMGREVSSLAKAASGPVRLGVDALDRPSLGRKKMTPFLQSLPHYHASPEAVSVDNTVRSLADIGSEIAVGQGGLNLFSQYR